MLVTYCRCRVVNIIPRQQYIRNERGETQTGVDVFALSIARKAAGVLDVRLLFTLLQSV